MVELIQENSFFIEGEPLVVKRTYPFRFAFLNDAHVCSQFGLFPKDGWSDHYGSRTLPNDGQAYLNECLDDYSQKCAENKTNILLCPGDFTIGLNPKEKGKFVMNIELDEQADIGAYVISEFCRKVPSINEVWLWKGTGYHGSSDSSIEKKISDKLNASYDIKSRFWGEYSFIPLKWKEYRKMLFITHPASQASMYPEQAMGKDMMLWQEAVTQKKLPKIDMIIRAHKHSFIEVHKPSIRSLQLPCWQFAVPYDQQLMNFARWQPDIGSVIMLFDEKLRTTVWHFTYDNYINPSRFINISSVYDIEETNLKEIE